MNAEIVSSFVDLFASSTSSSSSSDMDDKILFEVINMGMEIKKPRLEDLVTDVADKYTEFEFKEHFRVSKGTADMLAEKFAKSSQFKKKYTGGKKQIDAKTQMLTFLWFAGNKTSYREVANLFNLGLTSIHRQLNLILEFFFEISPNYIHFPETEDAKDSIASKFKEECGIDNVIGCIDACYISIRKPAKKIRSTYVNRHDTLSITLQGICDADKRFTDVFIVSSAKLDDTRVLQLSDIIRKLPAICGTQYFILGDAGYSQREYLLTPFKENRRLTAKQKRYNDKHSQGRLVIKNAFGLLKNRFRQLLRLDFFKAERMCKFLLACCVLHNICIDRGDTWDQILEDNSDDSETNPEEAEEDTPLRRLGDIKRNKVVLNI